MKKYLFYEIEGKKVPSVTTILNVLSKDGLLAWYGRLGTKEAERQRDEAADFGSEVHAAIEAVYHGQEPTITDPRLKSAVDNFKKWADHHIEEWVGFEKAVFHDDLLYAGTVDAFAKLKGSHRLIMIDFKGLPLDTPIPTPNGWSTMGQLKVGDLVLGRDGKFCSVTNKSSIHKRKSFLITFDDSSSIIADDEHQWQVMSADKRYVGEKVLSTLELNPKDKYCCIKNTSPLELPVKDLPIEPYLFGVWLGDGSSYSGTVTGMDEEIFTEIEKLGYTISPNHNRYNDKTPTKCIYGLRTKLREHNLFGKGKIPIDYLRGSIEQRLDLLKGLLDTDGTYNKKRKQAVFYNTNKKLVDTVYELAVSLGERPYIWSGIAKGFGVEVVYYHVIWRPTNFNPFKLSRKSNQVTINKASSYYRRIKSIVEIPPVDSQCITVNSPDSCYLAGKQMLPTHNTSKKVRDEHYLQVNAYCNATRVEDDFINLKDLKGVLILHLSHDTLTWEAVNADISLDLFEVFKACLTIYKWRNKTG